MALGHGWASSERMMLASTRLKAYSLQITTLDLLSASVLHLQGDSPNQAAEPLFIGGECKSHCAFSVTQNPVLGTFPIEMTPQDTQNVQKCSQQHCL